MLHVHDPLLESDTASLSRVDSRSASSSSSSTTSNYNRIQRLRREIANVIATDETFGHSTMNCDLNPSESSFVTGGFTLLQAIQQQPEQEGHDLQYNPYPEIPTKISTGSTSLDRLLTSQEEDHEMRRKDLDHRPIQTKKQKVAHGIPNGQGNGERDNGNSSLGQSATGGAGGISWKRITQVSGPSSSGKTQLGLMLAVNMMMLDQEIMRMNKFWKQDHDDTTRSRDYKVYYIASGSAGNMGGYGLVPLARRLRHLVSAMNNSKGGTGMDSIQTSSSRQQILDGIVLDSARDGYELLARLLYFEHEMHQRVQHYCRSRRDDDDDVKEEEEQIGMLLVIDSISGCLSPLLYAEGDGGVGAALLNEIHLTLRRISRFSSGCFQKYGIAVFVTNGMASDFKGGRKPALGDVWRAADIHVLLEPGRDISVVSQKIVSANDLKRVVTKSIYASLHIDGRKDKMYESNDDDDDVLNHGVMKEAGSLRVEFGIAATGIVDL
jgi:hypothetical protein